MSSIKIGIEASPLGDSAIGGLWSFLYNGVRELSKLDTENTYVLYAKRETTPEMLPVSVDANSRWQMRRAAGVTSVKPTLWIQCGFRRASAEDRLDVLWLTRHLPPLGRYAVPMVSTVFDLLFFRVPDCLSYSLKASNELFLRSVAKRSRRIIATSHATAQDITNALDVDPQRIDVAYGGVDHELFYPRNRDLARAYVKRHLKVERPFILASEVYMPRKNLENQLKAYAMLPRELRKQYAFIAPGRPARYVKNVAVEEIVRRLGLSSDVTVVDCIRHSDMPMMYSAASLLAFASRYEGFGLPIVEAMACECPVLTSRHSSMPEAGGAAALYASPEDPYDISVQMQRALTEPELVEEMCRLGRDHSMKFTWSAYANAVLSALRAAAQAN